MQLYFFTGTYLKYFHRNIYIFTGTYIFSQVRDSHGTEETAADNLHFAHQGLVQSEVPRPEGGIW